MEAESFHNSHFLEVPDSSGKKAMNIVFWSEEHDSGTTAHMHAVAGMLAVLCPETEIIWNHVPQAAGSAHRRKNPPQKTEAADVGSRSPQKVGDAHMRKYPLQEAETGIHIYDCGTGLDRRKRHMLWHADLVVVNLRQERACIEHFFRENFHIATAMIFLLDARNCEVGVNRAYLEQIYRVEPEEIAVFPYSNGFYQAFLQERSDSFIRQTYRQPENVENEQFVKELRRISLLILRKAEEWQGIKEKEEEQHRQRRSKKGSRKR